MNPFSAFLQPAPQRSLDLSGVGDVVRTVQGARQFKQQQLENTQRNALAQQGSKRADAELALQQGEQSHRFNAQDQKQQEDLLAEYHDAVDKFDPSDPGSQVRVQRAAEMLKRFGFDSQQGGAPPPNLKAFTGQDLLPNVHQAKPAESFKNPIDQAVETEQASRDALRARGEAPVSQADAEAKLIADSEANPAPERLETPEGTTPEGRAYLDRAHPSGPDELPPPTRDMGDVDSPQFRQAAKGEGENTQLAPNQEAQFQAWAKQNGIRDANDPRAHYDYRGYFIQSQGAPHKQGDHFPDTFKQHGHETFSEESGYSSGPGDGGTWQGEKFVQAPQAAAAQPPRLPGQLLPTVISKGGKVLESSSGQAGRYSPMVSGVFQPFLQNENPEMAQAGQRAQQIAQKLITVDGIAPRDAIKLGMDYLNQEANRINNLERTVIGSKAHVAAGVPGATPTFNPKARQFFTNEMHESVQKFKNENIEAGVRGYDSALTALNSSNPASQNDAINQLIAARSGKTVSDRERAIYENISGVWSGLQKRFNLAAGNPMPAEAKGQIRALLADAKQAVVQAREERARAAEAYHRAKLRGANAGDVDADSKAVAEAIRMGSGDSGGGDNADLWQ